MPTQPSYWKVLTRRKNINFEGTDAESKLNRVLGLHDLTALGVGSTLGAGIYVLAGQVAKEQAGPSVVLSFAIAALASLLAGACYAEFGARVPKAGSAYVYSYVCIGEFAAFVIGWNLILEYVVGTASVCRGISLYLDTLLNDAIKTTFADIAPINFSFVGSYFDFFACGLAVVFGIALAFGVETSTMLNNFCTCLNITVLLFVIGAGGLKANLSNWQVDPSIVNATSSEYSSDYKLGSGGFFPFGFAGTLKGAATCFFGFVGFDCIATTGEEVRNPQKNIPRSIFFSLLIIFLCYCGVSTVLTLMVPYYMQDPNAPLPYAFKAVGWNFAMWIVTVGGLLGLLASLFGALFPLPRVMYSMADDGLLFKFLGKISPRYRTPVFGSIFAAIMTGIISGLFDLAQLVTLLSIGTLMAYTVVAISITILRYMDSHDEYEQQQNNINQELSENSMLTSNGTRITFKSIMIQLFNFKRTTTPDTISTRVVGTLILLFCILSLCIGVIIMQTRGSLLDQDPWISVTFVILLVLVTLVLLAICLQPREANCATFRVPFVPFVPAISIFINIYLMLQLDTMTWIRFGIWMIIGIPMFIACRCMDWKFDRFVRNPRRRSFLRALKLSKTKSISNEYFKPNKSLAHPESTLLPTKSITSSLDDIISIDMEGETNKTTNYFPDVKRNSSDKGNIEEEKMAIAILDDVLQKENDDIQFVETGRHLSIDSESTPSFIQSTTIATIHGDSNLVDQISLERGDESAEYLSHHGIVNRNVNAPIYAESYKIAKAMLESIFNSDELWLGVTKKLNVSKLINNVSQRKASETEIDDPIRSEKFRNKLSEIFMRSQMKASATEAEPLKVKVNSQNLNYSTYEVNFEKTIPTEFAEREVKDESLHNSTNQLTSIPRAPKFDPVLYNTLGKCSALGSRKERPSLQNLKVSPSQPHVDSNTSSTNVQSVEENPISFRNKLEAILKSGPSHQVQKIFISSRNRSMLDVPESEVN